MPAMDLVWLPSPQDFESYEHFFGNTQLLLFKPVIKILKATLKEAASA